jgi:SAM-dependent methyltransferase
MRRRYVNHNRSVTSGPWPALGRSYDAVAAAYEDRFLDELDAKPRDRELLAAFVAVLPDGGPVLDVGCGPGQIGAFVHRASGRTVLGVDLSPAMAARAAGRLDGGVAADVLRLPIAEGCVAGAVAFYSLIHLRRHDLVAGAHELARVLRPGGQLLASFHEGEGEAHLDEFLGQRVEVAATFFTLDEVVDAFQAAGLRIDVTERRPPYATEGQTTRLYVAATTR